ncbi:hypothetical protein [Staphylococcus edaphicus]|uniref:Mid2-like cell wall stress sensor domain protein n=1 Tax=Staphylococcus edaphicus TaxID=1955013 RepID=A0ABY4QAE1_9STAP|nr:hypothetical protein [Staphylococcus edaphicus]UQW81455.1 hypothetical protein MNY58_13000 [Staphylococcus edaphicus]
MSFFKIILGILVICAWLFVINAYKKGHQNTAKAKNIMLLAYFLTLVMAVMQFFY